MSSAQFTSIHLEVDEVVVENRAELSSAFARGMDAGLAKVKGLEGEARLLATGDLEFKERVQVWTDLVTMVIGLCVPDPPTPIGIGANWEVASPLHLDSSIRAVTEFELATASAKVVCLDFRSEGATRDFRPTPSTPRTRDGKQVEASQTSWTLHGRLTRDLECIGATEFHQEARVDISELLSRAKRLSRENWWMSEEVWAQSFSP